MTEATQVLEPLPPHTSWKLALFAGVVIAFVTIPVALGAFEPREHEARTSIDLRSPPQQVYLRLAELGRWPTWNPYVGPMIPHGARRFETRPDPKTRLDYVLREANGSSRVVVALEARPRRLGAVWTFEIEPHGSGSRVRIHERGFMTSPTVRFAMRYLSGYDVAILQIARSLELAEREATATARGARGGTSPP